MICPTCRIEKHWERHKSVLTDAEKGEDDCGIDVELGNVEVREIHAPQKVRASCFSDTGSEADADALRCQLAYAA